MSKPLEQLMPVGYEALVTQFDLVVLPHYRSSYIALSGDSYVKIDTQREKHVYRKKYKPKTNTPFSHLEFALKYDGLNLEILRALFAKIDVSELTQYILSSPTGKYARITWFLYEWITDNQLKIDDLKIGNYVNVMDTDQYYSTEGIRSQRHRVINNLLGNKAFCPTVRKTEKLLEYSNKELNIQAEKLINAYDPNVVARAAQYLFTKETLSSYAIEREKPDKKREFKYIELLKSAPRIKRMTKDILIKLQHATVEERFANVDYRHDQNYVGETINSYMQRVHYISPKPEDIPLLMEGLLMSLEAMLKANVHPVVIAASIAFGFVFIHPFDDGNGRIHRFLIHFVLSTSGFTPQGSIFPVSTVMVENMREYDNILETFSIPLMEKMDYNIDHDGMVTVTCDSLFWYQYIDYTRFSEYLFSCIERTIEYEFKAELDFITHYDTTKSAIQNYIDMPDRLIDLAIKFAFQNKGKISHSKRVKYFELLTDNEIEKLEKIIIDKMNILS